MYFLEVHVFCLQHIISYQVETAMRAYIGEKELRFGLLVTNKIKLFHLQSASLVISAWCDTT